MITKYDGNGKWTVDSITFNTQFDKMQSVELFVRVTESGKFETFAAMSGPLSCDGTISQGIRSNLRDSIEHAHEVYLELVKKWVERVHEAGVSAFSNGSRS